VGEISQTLAAKEPTPGQAERISCAILQVGRMSSVEVETAIGAERAKRNHGQPDPWRSEGE
jgi:hypothetical protein